jgi:signal transduction histidine kinase
VRSQPAAAWIKDGAIAAAFAAAAQLELRFPDGGGEMGYASLLVSSLLIATIAPPLVVRRAAPFLSLCLVGLAVGSVRLVADVTLPFWGAFAVLVFALYSCSRHADRPLGKYGLAVPAVTLLMLTLEIRGFASWQEYSFSVPVLFAAWLVGQLLHLWDGRSSALRRHMDDISATEQARAATAVADERARIARELHDVVAHSISVMVVQAGSARLRLRTDPAVSEEALRSVEQAGRQALAEMRRMLGVLRTSDQELSLLPQPTLRGLDQLVDQVREAGLTVHACVEGVPVALPPGLDLSAYRIVQEALTNVLKHAGHAHAAVRVAYLPGRLELDIANQPGTAVPGHLGGGHGIVGMRERAALFDGSLKAGPRPGGGYQVLATIPLPAPEKT